MENDREKQHDNTAGDGMWETTLSSSVADQHAGQPAPGETIPPLDAGQPAGITPDKVQYPVWVIMLAVIGVFFISQYIAYFLVSPSGTDTGVSESLYDFISYVISFSLTIGFAWWICRKYGRLPARPLRFSLKKTNPTLILWGLILVVVTSIVLEPLLEIFPRKYLDFMTDAVGSGGWAMLTVVVAAPLLEEILFRGIVQQELVSGFGRIRGVIMAAAIFGVIHIIPQQAVNAFFIGIILGYLYIRSGSLVPGIIIHAINNAIAFVMMQFLDEGYMFTRDLFPNETFFWILYAVCCSIFIFAGWNLLRELKRIDRECAGQDVTEVFTDK